MVSFEGRCNHRASLLKKEAEAATDVQAWDEDALVESWPIMVSDLGTQQALAAAAMFEPNSTHRIRCSYHAEVKAGRLWRSETDGSEYLIVNVTILRGRRRLMSMYVYRQTEARP